MELFIPHDAAQRVDQIELLVLNDGQDTSQLHLLTTLHNVYADGHMKPMVIAAVYADENRLHDYGVASSLDFKRRGKTAKQYQLFIVYELIALVKEKVKINNFKRCHIAGFSMGALSAFDTAWRFDNVFYSAACFSGSFWWRNKEVNKDYHDNKNRIIHEQVKNTLLKPNVKFWFQTGKFDEQNDRNNNGLIDSIDDTSDLIDLLLEKGYKMYLDIYYREVQDGEHNFRTWSLVFPEYLVWLNYI